MGTTQEAFERHAQTITAIGNDRLRPRNEAMEDLFQEISELVKDVQEDRDAFAAIPRFDMFNIDSLEDRLLALIYLFGLYAEVALDKGDAKKQWDELEPAAQALKRTVIEALQFVFEEEGREDYLKEINAIAVGQGRKDLFCDYAQLGTIAKRELPNLVSMGVQDTVVEDLNAIFEQLLPLLGAIESTPEEVERRAHLVAQAYTWLDEAVSVIRRYGKFIFADNPEKLERYKSKSRMKASKEAAKTRIKKAEEAKASDQ